MTADDRFADDALDPEELAEYHAVLDERRAAGKTATPQHRPACVEGHMVRVTDLPDIATYRAA